VAVEDHPARPRIAEVLVTQAGEDRRGSGYLVAPGWVLTAGHVVADAQKVAVWLGAPPILESAAGLGVDPRRILMAADADLALLPVGQPPAEVVEPALLGRLDRDAATPVAVVAAGFPRFKLRAARRGEDRMLRELHEARGTITARSNAKTRTYELAGLSVVPDEDPEPVLHSPWEGMSGAAVWADGRLVGVVAEHHAGEGRGTLTVRPVEELFQASAAEPIKRWREALGPRLPARPGDLWLVRRQNVGEVALEQAYQVAAALAPKLLEAREHELADLDVFARSEEQWRWVQGPPYAGKTALLAWFATRPPMSVTVVSCFLRSTVAANTAEYAVETLNGQLAAVANRADYQPARFLPEKQSQLADLIAAAVRACTERGRRLLIVVDGLDEYDSATASRLCDWLPPIAALPAGAALLVASRSDVDVDLPPQHPLQKHSYQIAASDAASEIGRRAKEELRRALIETDSLQFPIVGFLAAAAGALTSTDLRALLKRVDRRTYVAEIEAVLRTSLGRTVTHLPDPDGIDGEVQAFAHAALRDAARTAFEHDLAEFEEELLGWGDTFRAARWPDDTPGYVLSHYPQHLKQVQREDDLLALLEDRHWYQRHTQYDPSASRYLTSINLAWRAAEAIDLKDIRAGEPPAKIGMEIRSTLTIASIGSLSSGIGLSLFIALVRCGYWTHQQALRVARRNPDARTRADSLVALAEHLQEPLLSQAIQEAMSAVSQIEDDMVQAWIWRNLAPHIPRALLANSLHLAQSIPLRLSDDRRPRSVALAAVLARMAQVGDGQAALQAAQAVENETDRAQVLAALARHLPSSLLPAALDIARTMKHVDNRAEALAGFASAPQAHHNTSVLQEAFDTARGVKSPERKSWILRRLAPHLPEAWIEDALAVARQELSKGNRWTLETALAARLGELGQWRRALDVARGLQNDIWLVRGLVAVASFVPEEELPALRSEMLKAAQAIQDLISLPYELAEVVPYLPEPLLRQALDFARAIPDGDRSAGTIRALLPRLVELGHPQEACDLALTTQKPDRSWSGAEPDLTKALATLIPHLPKPLQNQACREALSAAQRIDDAYERLWAIALQAPHLPEHILRWVLRSMRSVKGGQQRILQQLLPALPDTMLAEALEVAYAIPATERFAGVTVSSPQADALMALAARLPEPMRSEALQRAREAVAGIGDEVTRVKASGRLASQLSERPEVPNEVLHVATDRMKAIGPGYGRPEAVSMMGPYLPTALIEEIKQTTRASDQRRSKRVRSLTEDSDVSSDANLRVEALHRAFIEAKGIEDADTRAASLRLLAPHLALLLQRQDSEAQTERDWRRSQAEVLETLAPFLQLEQLPEALDAALQLNQKSIWGGNILAAYGLRLEQLPPADLYPLWQRTLHGLAPTRRPEMLRNLAGIGSLAVALAGSPAAVSMAQAIEDTGNWWP
jgi:Trypsin-like peptidase domain